MEKRKEKEMGPYWEKLNCYAKQWQLHKPSMIINMYPYDWMFLKVLYFVCFRNWPQKRRVILPLQVWMCSRSLPACDLADLAPSHCKSVTFKPMQCVHSVQKLEFTMFRYVSEVVHQGPSCRFSLVLILSLFILSSLLHLFPSSSNLTNSLAKQT